jgi:glycosyltransferase involved in cell wall biosynthesis
MVYTFVPTQISHFVAVSEGSAKTIKTIFSVSSGKLSVISNAVDMGFIESAKGAVEPLPKPLGCLRLVAVGRLVPQKGHEDLIVAFAEVVRELAMEAELLILGEGPDRPKLDVLIKKLELEHRVRLVGTVANPYAWMRTADLFVLASRWEPFGIVLIEAMALGLPVISTDTDGARDIVESGTDGILVPIGDRDGLARAILGLARSAQVRAAISRRALEKARRFDVSVIVPRYDKVLQKVLET